MLSPGGSIQLSLQSPRIRARSCSTAARSRCSAHRERHVRRDHRRAPAPRFPHADKNYVLVASEWYLSSPGFPQPASLDMAKAQRGAGLGRLERLRRSVRDTSAHARIPARPSAFGSSTQGRSFDVASTSSGPILDRAWIRRGHDSGFAAQHADSASACGRWRRLRRKDRRTRASTRSSGPLVRRGRPSDKSAC